MVIHANVGGSTPDFPAEYRPVVPSEPEHTDFEDFATMMRFARKLRDEKNQHPDRYCRHRGCLYSLSFQEYFGGYCPRHEAWPRPVSPGVSSPPHKRPPAARPH
jgi:hypothetical protein